MQTNRNPQWPIENWAQTLVNSFLDGLRGSLLPGWPLPLTVDWTKWRASSCWKAGGVVGANLQIRLQRLLFWCWLLSPSLVHSDDPWAALERPLRQGADVASVQPPAGDQVLPTNRVQLEADPPLLKIPDETTALQGILLQLTKKPLVSR